MWACSRGVHCNLTLKEKKGKENFMTGIRHCCQCKSFQSNAFGNLQGELGNLQSYLLEYHVPRGQFSAKVQQDCSKYGLIALEKLVGKFKRHQSELNLDFKFAMDPD